MILSADIFRRYYMYRLMNILLGNNFSHIFNVVSNLQLCMIHCRSPHSRSYQYVWLMTHLLDYFLAAVGGGGGGAEGGREVLDEELLIFPGLMTMQFFSIVDKGVLLLTSGQVPAPVYDILPSENGGARKRWVFETH